MTHTPQTPNVFRDDLQLLNPLIPATERDVLECFLPAVEMPVQTLQSALEVLTVLPASRILPVFRCMEVLVPKVRWTKEG